MPCSWHVGQFYVSGSDQRDQGIVELLGLPGGDHTISGSMLDQERWHIAMHIGDRIGRAYELWDRLDWRAKQLCFRRVGLVVGYCSRAAVFILHQLSVHVQEIDRGKPGYNGLYPAGLLRMAQFRPLQLCRAA